MGTYKYMREIWNGKTGDHKSLQKQRIISWRNSESIVRLERPTRLDRAKALGYKPISGVIILRARINRGGRKRPDIKGGRRSKHSGQTKILDKSYRLVAEGRAALKYPNMEILQSYFVGKDGLHYYYEVIAVDKYRPEVMSRKNFAWIKGHKDRVGRGLTASGKKSRGLLTKGKGAEKLRPSRTSRFRAKNRRFYKNFI